MGKPVTNRMAIRQPGIALPIDDVKPRDNV
jgi:hypothetical protein